MKRVEPRRHLYAGHRYVPSLNSDIRRRFEAVRRLQRMQAKEKQ